MQTWFEVKAQYVKVDQDGRERKVTETYLIDAVSFTDAEARITEQLRQMIRGEFVVKDIKQSNITEIFTANAGEWWYKCKISLITIDEKAGKERRVNNYMLANADDFKEAVMRLEEGLSYILVPYHIEMVQRTQIADIFPYFDGETKAEVQTEEQTEEPAETSTDNAGANS